MPTQCTDRIMHYHNIIIIQPHESEQLIIMSYYIHRYIAIYIELHYNVSAQMHIDVTFNDALTLSMGTLLFMHDQMNS